MAHAMWAILATALVMLPMSALAGKSGVMVVLGDSLSDDGNFNIEFTGRKCPKPPYFKGEFTNAPGVWAVQATAVGASTLSARNFAFGGATACNYPELNLNDTIFAGIPSLKQQAVRFNAKVAEPAFRRSLVGSGAGRPRLISAFLWGGHNDLLGALSILPPNQDASFTGRVAACINQSAQTLLKENEDILNGVVIATLAPLNEVLAGKALQKNLTDNGRNVTLATLIAEVNNNLKQVVNSLQQQYPNKTIALFDAHALLTNVTKNASSYGIQAPMNTSCLGVYPGYEPAACDSPKSVCKNPDNYFLWDATHPTSKVHGLMSDAVIKFMVNNNLARPMTGGGGMGGGGAGGGGAGGRRLLSP